MGEIVGMPVVMKGKDVRIRRARRLEGCHRSRTLMRLPVFAWWCSLRFPQFQCVKWKVPVIQMCGKMTSEAPTGPTHCQGTGTLRLWDNTKQQSSRQSRRRKRFLRSEAEVRSSGRRDCWNTTTDRRRSDVQMNTKLRLQEHNCPWHADGDPLLVKELCTCERYNPDGSAGRGQDAITISSANVKLSGGQTRRGDESSFRSLWVTFEVWTPMMRSTRISMNRSSP